MKKKQFPKELYVSRVDEGTENEFLNTAENIRDFGEIGKTNLVGKYALVEVSEVFGTVLITRKKAKKRQ